MCCASSCVVQGDCKKQQAVRGGRGKGGHVAHASPLHVLVLHMLLCFCVASYSWVCEVIHAGVLVRSAMATTSEPPVPTTWCSCATTIISSLLPSSICCGVCSCGYNCMCTCIRCHRPWSEMMCGGQQPARCSASLQLKLCLMPHESLRCIDQPSNTTWQENKRCDWGSSCGVMTHGAGGMLGCCLCGRLRACV